MGERGEKDDRTSGAHGAFTALVVALATAALAAPATAFARTVTDESVRDAPPFAGASDARPDAMLATREALAGSVAGTAGVAGTVTAPAADGIADWIVPRIAPPRSTPIARPRSFETRGSAHESRPLFGTIDGTTFRARDAAAETSPAGPFALAGIGFPHVETTPTTSRRHHRRFRPLLDWHGTRVPHARVRCMNLPSHVVTRRAAPYASTIERLAVEHGLAPSLVMAVVARESCFDPKAVSRAGAIGLMQLMPATARELREGDPRKPANNLRAGVRYLAEMHELFGSTELALAAYNAGPGKVRRHGGIPPFAETRAYIARVLAYQRRYRALELVASL